MQYNSLIHSYITDAIRLNRELKIRNEDIKVFFSKAVEEFFAPIKEDLKEEKRFIHNNKVIHFTKFD